MKFRNSSIPLTHSLVLSLISGILLQPRRASSTLSRSHIEGRNYWSSWKTTPRRERTHTGIIKWFLARYCCCWRKKNEKRDARKEMAATLRTTVYLERAEGFVVQMQVQRVALSFLVFIEFWAQRKVQVVVCKCIKIACNRFDCRRARQLLQNFGENFTTKLEIIGWIKYVSRWFAKYRKSINLQQK